MGNTTSLSADNIIKPPHALGTESSTGEPTHNFIVFKRLDSQPLYDRHINSKLPPVSCSDDIDFESALAFGGQKKRQRRTRRQPSTGHTPNLSIPSTDNVSSDSNLVEGATTERSSLASSRSSISSTGDHPEWEAFRSKYRKPMDHQTVPPYGRYGRGSGYIEYRHRSWCNGLCGGECLGK